MDREELSLLSEALRGKAFIASYGEGFLPRSCVSEALLELANARRVILGFDIVEILFKDKPSIRICGQSDYSPHEDLLTKTWNECVALSLRRALRDVERTAELSDVTLSDSDTWYAVVTMDHPACDELLKEHPEAAETGLIEVCVATRRRQGSS